MEKPIKILLVAKETAGDIFILTGCVDGLKQKYPNAKIYFACEKQYWDILEENEQIYGSIEFHESMYNYKLYGKWAFNDNAFDIVYVPTALTQILPNNWLAGPYSRDLYNFYADQIGIKYTQPYMKLPDVANLNLPDEYITVQNQSNQGPKDYEFLDEVVKNIKDIAIVQIGGQGEKLLPNAIDMLGKTSYRESAAIIKGATLHLGPDSCNMHFAMYVNTPSIVLFGGTLPEAGINPKTAHLVDVLLPKNRWLCATSCHLSACEMENRGLNRCINNIPVSQVLKTISNNIGAQYVKEQEKISLSSYIILKDGIRYGFPFQQCIEAAHKVTDEVIVVDGGSTDGTLESLELLKQRLPNLKIFKSAWDMDNPTLFGDEKSKARLFCKGNYLLQLDADEIIYEPYDGALRDLVEENRAFDVLDLPIINFYGDDETIRIEKMSWKWRISKNIPDIIHGVHAAARRQDNKGRLVMDKKITDGCEYVNADNFSICKHKPVFDIQYQVLHSEVLKSKDDGQERLEEAKKQYVAYLKNKLIPNECVVFHYSWKDLDRKLNNSEFWDQTWHNKYAYTHNSSNDIKKRIEKREDTLAKINFEHPLKS